MAYAYANISAASTGDTSRCLVWTGDLVDTGKAAGFGRELYLRLAGSHGKSAVTLPGSKLSRTCVVEKKFQKNKRFPSTATA